MTISLRSKEKQKNSWGFYRKDMDIPGKKWRRNIGVSFLDMINPLQLKGRRIHLSLRGKREPYLLKKREEGNYGNHSTYYLDHSGYWHSAYLALQFGLGILP
jgi:hypothetical protein